MFDFLYTAFLHLFAGLFLLSVLTYLLPYLWYSRCRSRQNLKKKYDAEWALVTGASSGIGLAITRRLAEQGMNVAVAAMGDQVLRDTMKTLRAEYKDVKFRDIPVNLAKDGFMEDIIAATEDILPQVCVLNAGYIVTGFFAETPAAAQIANFNCNAASVVPLAHHCISRLQNAGVRGCVAFTSSPAGFMPCPFSVMYGATKAFLTEFGASLAGEVAVDGIDICVVHPSPVTSNFYNKAHKLDALEMFRKTGTTPSTIADSFLQGVGRTVICDQGYYSIAVRMLLKIVDVTFIADIIRRTAHTMKDFKDMRKAKKVE